MNTLNIVKYFFKSNKNNQKKFVALICQGLGDLICSTLILKSLRELSPDSIITGIFKSSVESDFFLEMGLVDNAVVLDQNKKKTIVKLIGLLFAVRKLNADLFIAATDINQNKAAVLGFITGASKRLGESSNWLSKLLYTDVVAPNNNGHKVLSNNRIAELLGLPSTPSLFLQVGKLDAIGLSRKVPGLKLKYIVIHPGSGYVESHKRLPIKAYIYLINELKKIKDLEVYLVGGVEERELCDEIIAQSSGVNLAGLLSVRQTGELIRKSVVLVGADSGIMHLGAAVGSKVISVFGPTNPSRTCAYGDNVKVIWNKLKCSPCYPEKPKGCGNPECMNSVDAKEILESIVECMADV